MKGILRGKMMAIFSLILSVISLILSIYVIYTEYIKKITELENRIYLYEGVINELNNEITELKEKKGEHLNRKQKK